MAKPSTEEYPGHLRKYIELVQEKDLTNALENSLNEVTDFFSGLTSYRQDYTYAPGKWTIPGILLHISDTERIFAYRALRISRNDQTPLEGFNQDDYMKQVDLDSRYLPDLVAEFRTVRLASLSLFRSMDDSVLLRSGTANGNSITVQAIGFAIAGHASHHMRIIREKYLKEGES